VNTFLVTGAAGFIGSSLAKKLIELGNNVVTIDNLSTGSINNLPEGIIFYKGNCQDEKIIEKIEKYSFDAIFHIAGQSSGEISFDDPVYDLQTNTQSTLMLLKLALKTNCKKFIYASTMSVYGDQPDKPVSIDLKPNPKSFYGVGKLASENYMKIYQNYGINCTALRLFNVYGPGQNLDNLRQGMVSIFMAQAIKNNKIIVKGSKKRFRDFIYIDDVVNAFLKAYNKDNVGFNIFNISTKKKTTIKQLINIIIKSSEDKIEIIYSGSTPGDQFGIVGNYDSAIQKLNWEPKFDLETGMKKMLTWAIKQKTK
tara:strand:+ start:10601 stop:11533 length:933 start_codon:yes stop_codon:yes gene_type:complete